MPIEVPVFTAIPQISAPPSSIAATHASTSASASEPYGQSGSDSPRCDRWMARRTRVRLAPITRSR